MNVKGLITELQTYDESLPVVIESDNEKFRNLSYNDILIKEDIIINNRKLGTVLAIGDY